MFATAPCHTAPKLRTPYPWISPVYDNTPRDPAGPLPSFHNPIVPYVYGYSPVHFQGEPRRVTYRELRAMGLREADMVYCREEGRVAVEDCFVFYQAVGMFTLETNKATGLPVYGFERYEPDTGTYWLFQRDLEAELGYNVNLRAEREAKAAKFHAERAAKQAAVRCVSVPMQAKPFIGVPLISPAGLNIVR